MAKNQDSAFAGLFKNLDSAQIQMNYYYFISSSSCCSSSSSIQISLEPDIIKNCITNNDRVYLKEITPLAQDVILATMKLRKTSLSLTAVLAYWVSDQVFQGKSLV